MKFDWFWLIIAIIAVTAFAVTEPKYGKWLFAIVILGALVLASNKIGQAAVQGK
jgi:hypothetical protein